MKSYNKNSFTLIELVISIVLITIVVSAVLFNYKSSDLDEGIKKLKLYLNYTRYVAFIDNKIDMEDSEYIKKYWTLKFQKCSKKSDGLYFVVYSDESGGTAHFKKEETLKDPLSKKYLYSNYDCDPSYDESKYILLTKQYGIENIILSCNSTTTIGQLSFSNSGDVYTKLGSSPKLLNDTCYLDIYDSKNNTKRLTIEPKTGYIH